MVNINLNGKPKPKLKRLSYKDMDSADSSCNTTRVGYRVVVATTYRSGKSLSIANMVATTYSNAAAVPIIGSKTV